ncbi:MAG: LrgB family protein [Candidatus Velthaea sp.]
MHNEIGVTFAAGVVAGAYVVALELRKRWVTIATTPILTTCVLAAIVLLAARVPSSAYGSAAPWFTAWLVPACAALGVAMYRQRQMFRAHARVIGVAVVAGTLVTVGTAIAVSTAFALPPFLTGVAAMKSVTAPVALQIGAGFHLDLGLVAIVVVGSGAFGAIIGPGLLTRLGVRDSLARGIALGSISHGIGTAQAATESDVAAAASSMAMCLVALAIGLIGAPLAHVLLRVAP